MAKVQYADELQIDQDLAFEARFWVVQRVAWGVMALVILAGVAGLFGAGPLSDARVGSADGSLELEYERFARFHAPTTLRLRLDADGSGEALKAVWLDRQYVDGLAIEQVTPRPEAVEVDADALRYLFRVADRGGPVEVTFQLKPERIGPLSGRAGLVDGPSVSFRQLVYP
jgi:hypothetical protein